MADPAPTITTERLVLTRLARGDVDDLVAMLLEPALYQWIGGAPASADEATGRVERWLAGSPDPDVLWLNYVTRGRGDGRLAGLAQATVRDARENPAGPCEIAYLVDPSAQGRGVGTEMMRGLCAELRESVRPRDLTANILPGHTASEGVVRALGFAPTPGRVDGEQVWRATTR